MFKQRITGAEFVIINTLPVILKAAQETLKCGGDLQDINSLDIDVGDHPPGLNIEILAVTVKVNLHYVRQKPAIVLRGKIWRNKSPRSRWMPALHWQVNYGSTLVDVDLPGPGLHN